LLSKEKQGSSGGLPAAQGESYARSGLLGGNNVFQYALNPVGWINPLGLSCVYRELDK